MKKGILIIVTVLVAAGLLLFWSLDGSDTKTTPVATQDAVNSGIESTAVNSDSNLPDATQGAPGQFTTDEIDELLVKADIAQNELDEMWGELENVDPSEDEISL
ncbi:MAG: hypothetical protein Q8Q20_01115 [bacterium]|nr:hypothetical protein [bacterium]